MMDERGDNGEDVTGVDLIAAERRRQVEAEGWTPEHDDEHGNRQLARAAHCYVFQYLSQVGWLLRRRSPAPPVAGHGSVSWPWHAEWWKPSEDPIRNLVKAGALIAAEIDRLQRADIGSTVEVPNAHE